MSLGGLARASARLKPLYWLVLVLLFVADLYFNVHAGIFGEDFRGTIWHASRDVLHGRSPYPRPDAAALAWVGNPAVYPAATLVALSPLGLLPFTLSAVAWDVASVAMLVGALRLVGVRDRRIYAVVLFSFPVAASVALGQFDAVLALGCALVWRWREARGLRFAVSLGALLVAKLLLWPLLLWAAATRRRQALGGAVAAVVAAVGGWAVIGFAGFTSYPHLLSSLTYAFGDKGYSLMALGSRLGAPPHVSRWLPLLAAAGLCALCVSFARRGRDADAFVAAVGAGLLGSPILWLHYAVILLVVLAVKWPTFGPVWAVPLGFWLVPTENPQSGLEFAIGLSLIVLLLAVSLRPRIVRAIEPSAAAHTSVATTVSVRPVNEAT
jgi:hypothetical protein